MRLGMVGLGRMGGDMTRRLMAGGHEVVVYDLSEEAIGKLAAEGATGTNPRCTPASAEKPSRIVYSTPPPGMITA